MAVAIVGTLGACSNAETPTDSSGAVPGTDAAIDCGDALPLSRELSSGARWSMCFTVESQRGMVLSDVRFTTPDGHDRPVATEIALAQLEVPYDDGERLTSDITDAGFGGPKMRTLSKEECPDGRIEVGVPNIGDGTKFGETPVRDVLCSEMTDAGLAYRSEENGDVVAGHHDAWTLWTVSKVGWYEYVTRYTFGAEGSIHPELGATGDLSPLDYSKNDHHSHAVGEGESDGAVSHSHNAVWRIHWALDDEQRVEQYDAKPTGQRGSESPKLDGTLTPLKRATTARLTDRRWWRVVAPDETNSDGHPISYEIDLTASDRFTFADDQEHHGADAGYDVAFTNADDCQLFATANRGGCGTGVLEYVADSDEPLEDVVSWVAVGFHHVPRDEDQSPMQLHWQGYTLTPRDFTAQRVDVPDARSDYNGQPEQWDGETIEDLERMDDPLDLP